MALDKYLKRSYRSERVGSLIKREISYLLTHDISIDGFALSISNVVVSRDLSLATVYFFVMNKLNKVEIDRYMKKLDQIKPSVRKILSGRLRYMRKTPIIEFRYDEMLDTLDFI